MRLQATLSPSLSRKTLAGITTIPTSEQRLLLDNASWSPAVVASTDIAHDTTCLRNTKYGRRQDKSGQALTSVSHSPPPRVLETGYRRKPKARERAWSITEQWRVKPRSFRSSVHAIGAVGMPINTFLEIIIDTDNMSIPNGFVYSRHKATLRCCASGPVREHTDCRA